MASHLVLLILLAQQFNLLPKSPHLVAVLHGLVPDLPGFGSIPVTTASMSELSTHALPVISGCTSFFNVCSLKGAKGLVEIHINSV